MITFESLHIAGLDETELGSWIEASWVRARGPKGAWRFEEVDVARIRLIHTLRHDLDIGEPAMPVVLSLLDQLYELRRNAARLNEAMAALPPAARAALLEKLDQQA
ncbi:chaperone modulator CbpM [Acidocella sp.]|uniref:chaperone modulator CbpM n=1 Tax=Acidocella sp. TaxID=50710 RepID=UPI003CFF53C4